jgi:hypothetical protein
VWGFGVGLGKEFKRMERKYFLICFLILSNTQIFCQEKITVSYDYFEKKLVATDGIDTKSVSDFKYKKGTELQVKIDKIPLYHLRISINNSDTSFSSTAIPSISNSAPLTLIGTLAQGLISTATSSIGNGIIAPNATSNTIDNTLLEKLRNVASELIKNVKNLNSINNAGKQIVSQPETQLEIWSMALSYSNSAPRPYIYQPTNSDKSPTGRIDSLENEIKSIIDKLKEQLDDKKVRDTKLKNAIIYDATIMKEVELLNKAATDFKTQLLEELLYADSIERETNKFVLFSSSYDPFETGDLIGYNKNTYSRITYMKTTIDSILQIRLRLHEIILNTNSLFNRIQSVYFSIDRNSLPEKSYVFSELDSLTKRVNRVILTGTKSLEAVAPERFFPQYRSIMKLNTTRTVSNFISAPIQLVGDKTMVKIEISPKSDSLYLNKEIIEFELKAIRNKCFFSSGGAFYLSSLRNDNYSVQQIVPQTTEDTSVTFKLVEEYSNTFETGLLTLTYVGSMDDERSKLNDFGLHFGAGVGSSFTRTPKFRFTLGLGGFYEILNRHMLSVNVVMMTGYVDRLSKSLSLDQTYLAKPENFLVSKLALGGAIAIGYSFRISN